MKTKRLRPKIFILTSRLIFNRLKSYIIPKLDNPVVILMKEIEELIDNLPQEEDLLFIVEESLISNQKEELLKFIENRNSQIKILLIFQEIKLLDLYKYLKAGISGFINPNWSKLEFHNALDALFKGEFIFPRLLFSDFLLSIINSPKKSWELFSLSKKEKLVAGYLIEGMTNKEIAKNMKLTEKTVKTHLTHIYKKLSCRNRSEAIVKLIR